MDPDYERFSLKERNVHGALLAYKQIYNERINKLSKLPWIYSWRVTPPLNEPQGVPSGGIPEGTIILEDDNSMCVTAPEDLPVR